MIRNNHVLKIVNYIILLGYIMVVEGCKNSPKVEDPCYSQLKIKKVLAEYSENGGPLKTYNFKDNLNPKWTQKDFQVLRYVLEESNPNLYRYSSKSIIDSMFDSKLCELNDSFTYLDFVKHVAEVFNTMACGHSGWAHSGDFLNYRQDSMKFFPLNIVSQNNEYFIRQNHSFDTSLKLGSQIITINGMAPSRINEILRNHMYKDGTSIPDAERDISLYFKNAYSNFIENPDSFTLSVIDDKGEKNLLKISALLNSTIDSISNSRNAYKKKVVLPLSFVNSDKTSLLRIKTFNNEVINSKDQNFNTFIDSAFKIFHKNDTENLIIDIRGNTGGWTANGKKLFSFFINKPSEYVHKVEFKSIDTFTFQPLIIADRGIEDSMKFTMNDNGLYQWINYPSLEVFPAEKYCYEGKVYILVDERSRSCSAIFASLMSSHSDAIFIGEEIGASQSGQGGMVVSLTLPYTGLKIYTSTAMYTLITRDPKNSNGVQPDYYVQKSMQKNGDDEFLHFTYNLVTKGLETN